MSAPKATSTLIQALLSLTLLLLPAAAWAMEVPDRLSTGIVAYYTFAATIVGLYSLGMYAARFYQELGYSLYGLLALLLIALMDGTLPYLFGGTRWLMTDAPLLIGAILVAYGFWFVAIRLQEPAWLLQTKPLMLFFALLGALLIPGYWLTPSLPLLYAILNTLLVLMVFSTALTANRARSATIGRYRAALVWPLLLGISLVLLYSADLSGGNFSRATIDQINRALILVHLLHLMFGASFMVYEEVRARQAAERAALEAAQKNAEASLALERSEHNFERAQRLAQSRSEQLASASHDLRQPIAALRLAMQEGSADTRASANRDTQRIRDAIDYLDQLAGSYLQSGTADLEVDHSEVARDLDGTEPVVLELIIRTVAAMFEHDAQAAGVRLLTYGRAVTVQINPLALTRALCNIVSNALNHAQATKVLIGVRPASNRWRLEVHDNGIGMSAREARQATALGHRGDQSSGSGLGLAIVTALAEDHDWSFDLHSRPGVGTIVRLTL